MDVWDCCWVAAVYLKLSAGASHRKVNTAKSPFTGTDMLMDSDSHEIGYRIKECIQSNIVKGSFSYSISRETEMQCGLRGGR